MKAWKKEEVLNLVDLFRGNPCLWDPSDVNYRKKEHKIPILKSIAEVLNRSVDDVEKKLHSMRTSFNAAHKRYRAQVLLNSDIKVEKPTWFAYEALEFLSKCYYPASADGTQELDSKAAIKREASWLGIEVEISSGSSTDEASEIDLDTTKFLKIEHEEIKCEEITPLDFETVPKYSNKKKVIEATPVTKKVSGSQEKPKFGFKQTKLKENSCVSSSTPVNKIAKQGRSFDEYEAFGNYVAQELRKIKNAHAKKEAKLRINQVLFEATTGRYDQMPSFVSNIKTK